MPTGYTAAVCDGKMTDFSEFALSCARAFGALVTMRDDPHDAPIPDAIAPSSYNSTQYAAAKDRLRELQAMTPEQAQILALKAYDDGSARATKWNAETDAANDRINTMLRKVRDWTPPTPDHIRMKEFMIEQLEISLTTYRHKSPPRLDGPAWLAAEIAKTEHDLEYHGKEQREENEAKGRTKWLRDLRASLTPTSVS